MKLPINTILNPNWVTGFSDGESSFMIIVSKSNTHKIGYKVKAVFGITLHSNDVGILKDIQTFFKGVGNIFLASNKNVAQYLV